MPSSLAAALHVLLLVILLVAVFPWLGTRPSTPTAAPRGRRPLRPRTPDDCPQCRQAAATPPTVASPAVVLYPQLKSRRGRRKTVATQGHACPNPNCRYFNNPDPAVHALVGDGHHGCQDRSQDFYCQGCHRKFTARRQTVLYRLKSPPALAAQVLHALAAGLSLPAAVRVFELSDCGSTSGSPGPDCMPEVAVTPRAIV